MDVVMPGASGFHATRSIAKDRETESIPVIMLTSKDQVADKLWAFRQGAMGYLVKPVAERELMDTVDNLLEITTLADTREAC
jgi:twitching motility two-component system response regulator PilH